jgi:MFS-type transporter involved in bile tolerance (Atg22 family)
MGIGPLLGALAGRWPLRRSVLVLCVVRISAPAWSVVLLWPGRAPVWLLALLVLVLAGNGPGSILGFDFARTENPPARFGSATGIVNVDKFVATLLMILVVGLLLDASGSYRVAMSAQYVFWAVGLIGVLVTRRQVRRHRNIVVDAFPSAVLRRLAAARS